MSVQPDLFPLARRSTAPAQRHSLTSVAAAEAITPHLNRLEAQVLQAYQRAGARGLTDEECQTATGLGGSTQRPRRVRLVELGLVRDAVETRRTASGRAATVWRVSDTSLDPADRSS